MLWGRRKCLPVCQGSNTRDPRPWIKYLQGKHHATCFPTSILLSHVTQSASRCHKPGRATDGSWCWNTRARLLPSSLRFPPRTLLPPRCRHLSVLGTREENVCWLQRGSRALLGPGEQLGRLERTCARDPSLVLTQPPETLHQLETQLPGSSYGNLPLLKAVICGAGIS